MWSEWMWGSQCSVSGRRSLCHPHRGTERLMVWWSTGAADWFRQYLDTKHRSLSGSHSTLAMIAQMQLPSFNSSGNRSTGARKLTDNFYWFSQHAVLRQVHRSEPHDPQEQSGHPQWFLTSPHDPRSSLVIGSEIDVSSILFRELVLPLVPADGHCDVQLWTSLPGLWVSRKGEKKNHTSKSCSFIVFVESNCKLKRSRWGILLNTQKGQTWQQQCQHALWTFTWQGRTPIRLSRASSHDVTMTTCIRAIAYSIAFDFFDLSSSNLVQESSVDLWDNLSKFRGLPHNALHFPSPYPYRRGPSRLCQNRPL